MYGIGERTDYGGWFDIDYKEKTIIVFGSEGRGIREKVLEICDFKATIEMQGSQGC